MAEAREDEDSKSNKRSHSDFADQAADGKYYASTRSNLS